MFNNQTAQGAQNSNQFGNFGRGCGGFRGPKQGRQMPPWMHRFAGAFDNRVPVNIEESDEAYTLSVYAAGLVKEGFTVSVKDDVLSIAYKAADNNEERRYSHQEFTPGNFERVFQLNGKVLAGNINATYANGVLTVTLPKDPEAARPATNVNVD